MEETNEITYKKNSEPDVINVTASERKSSKYLMLHWSYYTRCIRRFKQNGRIQF